MKTICDLMAGCNILQKCMTVFCASMFCLSCTVDESAQPQAEESPAFLMAGDEMAEILLTRYGIETTILEDNEYSFKFLDGRIMKVIVLENEIVISGSRINNLSYSFENLTEVQINLLDQNSIYLLSSNTLKADFIFNVNDLSNLTEEERSLVSPCDEHPTVEEFNDCFVREWEEFCDGFIGCVTQATHPMIVAAIIAGHCAAC